MKLLNSLLLTCSLTSANFLIYGRFERPGESGTAAIAFFGHPPSCDDICNGKSMYYPKEDVSGNRDGVRCEGCNESDVCCALSFSFVSVLSEN